MRKNNTTDNLVITSSIFYDARLFAKFLIKNEIIQTSQENNVIDAEKAFFCKRVFFSHIRQYEEGKITKEEVERIFNILDKYVKNEVDVIWNTEKNTIQVKRN